MLAREPVKGLGVIDRAAALKAAGELERQTGVSLDWDMPVEAAPVHVRQILEILRLLYRGADVLILDEPTAVLAPSQIRDLMQLLKRLRDEGRTILFISHKLDEVMAISDDITVMRSGKVVRSLPAADTSKTALAELMIARPCMRSAPIPERRVKRCFPPRRSACRCAGCRTSEIRQPSGPQGRNRSHCRRCG